MLRVSMAGSVSGFWLWHTRCSCGLQWRGAEHTPMAARREAFRFRGPRDVALHNYTLDSNRVAERWPGITAIRKRAQQLPLPDALRGTGHIVAVDGSLRGRDHHAGWAAITDTGWFLAGTVDHDTANIKGLELLAIAKGISLYPARTRVHVWSDNADARALARRILAGQLHQFTDAPHWVPYEAWRSLRASHFRRVRVQIVAVSSKTLPLHDIADRLARGLPVGDLLSSQEAS